MGERELLISTLDGLLDAARRLERAETVVEERLAKDAVRAAINLYDARLSHMASVPASLDNGKEHDD